MVATKASATIFSQAILLKIQVKGTGKILLKEI